MEDPILAAEIARAERELAAADTTRPQIGPGSAAVDPHTAESAPEVGPPHPDPESPVQRAFPSSVPAFPKIRHAAAPTPARWARKADVDSAFRVFEAALVRMNAQLVADAQRIIDDLRADLAASQRRQTAIEERLAMLEGRLAQAEAAPRGLLRS